MSSTDGAASAPERNLRERLLSAAEAEVNERGLANLSLRSVARRVGVSHQAPAHHYRNRKGLLTALTVHGQNRLRDEWAAAIERLSDEPAQRRLVELAIVYARFTDENHGLMELLTSPDLIERGAPEVLQARLELWELWKGQIAAAQAEGWRADQSTEAVALLQLATVHGAVSMWTEGPIEDVVPGQTLESLVELVARSL